MSGCLILAPEEDEMGQQPRPCGYRVEEMEK